VTVPDMTDGEVKFWTAGVELRQASHREFSQRQLDYGDIWLDLDLETLCGTVRAEANRIRPEMTKEKLRHRIIDLNAYLTMLYRLTEESLDEDN